MVDPCRVRRKVRGSDSNCKSGSFWPRRSSFIGGASVRIGRRTLCICATRPEVFGARLSELADQWRSEIAEHLQPARHVNIVTAASREIFGQVSDDIRRAAEILAERMLRPEEGPASLLPGSHRNIWRVIKKKRFKRGSGDADACPFLQIRHLFITTEPLSALRAGRDHNRSGCTGIWATPFNIGAGLAFRSSHLTDTGFDTEARASAALVETPVCLCAWSGTRVTPAHSNAVVAEFESGRLTGGYAQYYAHAAHRQVTLHCCRQESNTRETIEKTEKLTIESIDEHS